MNKFKLVSPFSPMGDQPAAIKQLVSGINDGLPAQTLLGVTGSGKTFTMANVIQQTQKPTLILSHNKTLVAQLYGEFKQFFPENSVEYYVSYYDYYQPEAYMPSSGVYIEKDLSINEEIEKFRLKTSSSLLSGRKDIIVVASVSCIYGVGNPAEFDNMKIVLNVGQQVSRNILLRTFVDSLYSRTEYDFKRGTFRVKGDIIDIYPGYMDLAYRIEMFGDEIDRISQLDPISGHSMQQFDEVILYPTNIYVSGKDKIKNVLKNIQDDMVKQVDYFKEIGKHLEAKRLEEKVVFDLEMIRELGYCSGIENYSRYLDKRNAGDRPFCLLDYFPDDFLLIVDESHVTLPQVRAMYGGDRARKINLVEHGFRLPAAMDNRPLKFDEFQQMVPQTVYVSATPADFEIEESEGVIVEQLIRPTGLLDPLIEVRPCINQVDDLLDEIDLTVKKNERVLVTTLTKRMAEELAKYLSNLNIKCSYIHSEVKTLDRVEILRDLRLGNIDVLIGINLLREGLDLPEVSLVTILDADKEGFLRSETALTQTIGRAARNVKGRVILYADRITGSMQRTIDKTNYRREKQMAYNLKHNIVPTSVVKSVEDILGQTSIADKIQKQENTPYNVEPVEATIAADPVLKYMSKPAIEKALQNAERLMKKAAKNLEFMEAARLRDEITELKKRL